MPDVGVLNLQIHDDSEKAAQGLEGLVGVLERVKDACGFGRNLGTIATNLDKLSKVINDSIQGSTVAKLNELATALEKMQNIGKVNIRIAYGKEDEFNAVARAFEQTEADSHGIITNIQESARQTEDLTAGFTESEKRISGNISRVEELEQTIQEASASAQQFDYSKFDPANLPMGALGATLREAETEWAQYKDKVQETDKYIQQIGTSMNAIIPYSEKNEDSWESISERIREASRVAKVEYEKACEEALKDAQKLNSEIANAVRALPKRTIEDYYHGMRFERQEDGTDKKVQVKDMLTEQLRGMGTPNEQLYAFQTVAKELGMTVEEVKAKIEELKAAEAGVGEQATHGIDSLNNSLSVAEKYTEKARNALEKIKEAASGLKGGFSKLFPTISSLVKGFGRIAKYRILRTILKQISSGISEGVQNVYYYSKAVGTSLAPAMDSAASALLQMKNSIGAAVAPVIESLVPVLQTVVNWFITAVNYANQFFALIRGQKTWTRAVPATTKAFDDQTKAAKGAGAAIKDLLADWDELNIIQSESGGGGSIGATENATDYLNMFEEVGTFNNEIRDIVDFLKDNFGDIKETALAIGTAILGWKLSTAFEGVLGVLGTLLGEAATIYFTLKLTDSFGKEFVETGKPGWFIADALTGAVGATLAGTLAAKIAGGAWGVISAGFTLRLAGNVNLKNSRTAFAQEKNAHAQMLAILGSVEKGIGSALIAAGFTSSVPLALAIGGASAIYTYAVNALASVNVTGIKWGTESLSADDVVTFVKDNMLTPDIEAQIKVTSATLDLAADAQESLATQATKLLKPVNALKLGVNIDDSLKQIETDIFGEDGLIKRFKEFTASQKEVVNSAETYAPTIVNGENISAEILNESNSAWDELNGLMDGLGADLSKHLTRAMDKTLSEELRQFELNAVEEITDTMIRVSLAGQRATVTSDALTDLAFNLNKASEGTFSDILNVYEAYRSALYEQNMALKKEEAASFAKASAMYAEFAEDALKKAGGDETDALFVEYTAKAKRFADRYTEIMGNLVESVETSVDEATVPGKELLRSAILDMLQGAKELKDGRVELFTGGKIKGLPTGAAGGLKEKTDLAHQNLMFNREDKQAYKDFLDAIIEDYFPDDFNIIKELLDTGVINYDDIFDPEALFSNMKNLHKWDSSYYREMWNALFGTTGAHELSHAELGDGQVAVLPDITITDEDEVRKRLRQAIDEAIGDGVIDTDEALTLMIDFGANNFNDLMEELGYHVDEMLGGGGEYQIETEYGEPSYPTTQTPYTPENLPLANPTDLTDVNITLNESDISGGVKEGTSELSRGISDMEQTISLWLQRIYNKEFNVNFTPSTAVGLVGRASQVLLNNVTGENVP